MKFLLITVLSGALFLQSAFADESAGFIKKKSPHSVRSTGRNTKRKGINRFHTYRSCRRGYEGRHGDAG